MRRSRVKPAVPPAIEPETLHRILVIRPGGLGDAALTYPMLKVFRQCLPETRLDMLVERRNSGVYSISDCVDAIYHYDKRPLAILRELRRNRYDLVIDTEQYHHFSTLFANALQPRYLCGFDTFGRDRFQTHPVPHDENTYEVFSFLNLAESVLGEKIPFDPERAFIDVNSTAMEWARDQCSTAGIQNFVAIAPGAAGPYRRWPAERYAAVASRITRRNFGVIVLGASDAAAAARQIVERNDSKNVLDLSGQTTLAQTAAILQRAYLSLSADTGILHIASGVGTPTIALFGPGLHRKWAPPGKRHSLVRKGLACSPCTRSGQVPPCPHGVACMEDISVNDVMAVLEEKLDDLR